MSKKLLIFDLIDETYCYERLREIKWKSGLECLDCGSKNIRRNGHDKGIEHRQRYVCKNCNKSFTDISNTVIASNHVPIQKWMACATLKDFMSNKQMAKALELSEKVVGDMRSELSEGFVKNTSLNDWDW
jgi:transposase-like protein